MKGIITGGISVGICLLLSQDVTQGQSTSTSSPHRQPIAVAGPVPSSQPASMTTSTQVSPKPASVSTSKPVTLTRPRLGKPIATSGSAQTQRYISPPTYHSSLKWTPETLRGQSPDLDPPMIEQPVHYQDPPDDKKKDKKIEDILPPPTPLPDPNGPRDSTSGAIILPEHTFLDDCGYCDGLTAPGWVYGSAEYLLWWIRDSKLPPLVTSTTRSSSLGVLGEPGTGILVGGTVSHEEFNGGRFTLGTWLDDCQIWALEGNYFFLGQKSIRDSYGSTGVPVLARPFFNLNENSEDAQLVANPAFPNLDPLAGAVAVSLSTELWGVELNLRRNLIRDCCGSWIYYIDGLVGYRHMDLRERLRITESLFVPAAATNLPGARFQVVDLFRTENRFDGIQLGLLSQFRYGCWTFDLRGKLGLGQTRQIVEISGATRFKPRGGAFRTANGGLLALPSNIGQFKRDSFSIVPELGVNIGYQLCDNVRLFAGYTLIYWTDVVRPGDQIDRVINTALLPSFGGNGGSNRTARPAVMLKDRDFWAHGVNFGLEVTY